jgi:SAM-dependent methyltransferase
VNKSWAKREFDGCASQYDADLAQGLSVSGEDKAYFARGRIAGLDRCLRELTVRPQSALDFGCGTGSASPFFFELIGVRFLIGIDVSLQSLQVAQQTHSSERVQFLQFNEHQPGEQLDLAFCNGVFHHIPVDERAAAVDYVHRSLRRGGIFALWENNPWNPGTRYVMSRIPFDKDAITLTPPEARRMLEAGGFEVLSTSFLFIFPRALSWLRGIEPLVSSLPLGAQYQVLCRKP